MDIKKIKVMCIVGTRPEIIRLSRVIAILDQYCELTLVHTGQNFDYELNQVFFNDLEIRMPDFFLQCANNSTSPMNSIGNLISSVDKLLSEVQPEALLILGDTNSCLSAIPAKRRKIPLFHMEAGNRCFDMRTPEEINRRIVDHIADINLTYSSIAREHLLKEGLPADQVIKIGSPMQEVLNYYMPMIQKSEILKQLNLVAENYFVFSFHREENIESDCNFTKLVHIINSIAEEYKLPVILSIHPRVQNRINSTKAKFNKHILLLKPLGFYDYINLQMHAKVVLSDSGTISEESSILNFPALNLRQSHERLEAMEEASVMMVGLELDRVRQGLDILQNQGRGKERDLYLVNDYSPSNVSKKVLRIIVSYIDYINRVVWKMY
jgi:UDP-N-acetylglucosamine 2-epimerase